MRMLVSGMVHARNIGKRQRRDLSALAIVDGTFHALR
jgi:hypothetical protein